MTCLGNAATGLANWWGSEEGEIDMTERIVLLTEIGDMGCDIVIYNKSMYLFIQTTAPKARGIS